MTEIDGEISRERASETEGWSEKKEKERKTGRVGDRRREIQ